MDVEDEDDEGAESQNASADQDGLETSMNSQGLEEGSGRAEDGAAAAAAAAEQSQAAFPNSQEHLESEEALELSQE